MITDDVVLGRDVKIYQPELVNLYGCEIGDETSIGAFVEIGRGVIIGSRVKILPFAFIPTGVTIKDGVFIGPGVIFTNDRNPSSTTRDGKLKTDSDWKLEAIVVQSRASIGANATIRCGVSIGEGATVGAGAVVTKDVPAGATVVGVPAELLDVTQ